MKTKWFAAVMLTALIALSVTTVQVNAATLNGGDSIEPAEAFPSAMSGEGGDAADFDPAE